MDSQIGRKRPREETSNSSDEPIKKEREASPIKDEGTTNAHVTMQTDGAEDLLSALSITNGASAQCGFRLEAIFLPKFENESRTDQSIRKSMMELVTSEKGYVEVTLKHSGSLLLWSGSQRFYSKNSTNNQFTFAGEILLRQHFYRFQQALADNACSWTGNISSSTREENDKECVDVESLFQKCSDYVEEHRLTLSFEIVTPVLGDHGAIPQRDYIVLTAVADRSRHRQHFYSTLEILQLAQRLHLPHNDAWIFAESDSLQKLFQYYDKSRETGLANTAVRALNDSADVIIQSIYPHEVFHSNILEGFVIRYVPFSETKEKGLELLQQTSKKSRQILQQIPTTAPSCSEMMMMARSKNKSTRTMPTVLTVDLRALYEQQNNPPASPSGTDQEMNGKSNDKKCFEKQLQNVLQESGPRSTVENVTSSSLQSLLPEYCNSLLQKTSSQEPHNTETVAIAKLIQTLSNLGVRVHYSVFSEEPKQQSNNERHLRRWLCMIHIYHDRAFQKYRQVQKKNLNENHMDLFRGFCIEICISNDEATKQNGMNLKILPVSDGDSDQEDCSNALILKVKFVPYLVRTFGCRNGLRFLKQGGLPQFNDYATDLLTSKWQVSLAIVDKWLPYLQAWGEYVLAHWNGTKWPLGTPLSWPPLKEENYLKHLMLFEEAYNHQKQSETNALQSQRETTVTPAKKFKGLVIVLAAELETAKQAAQSIARDCLNDTKLLEGGTGAISREGLIKYCTPSIGGRVCWGTLTGEKAKNVRNLSETEKKCMSLILVGCSDKEIDETFETEPKNQRKFKGISQSWRKTLEGVHGSVIDLPNSFHDSAKDKREATGKLWKVSDGIGDVDERSGLLVFFPLAIPGCGKSTILASDTAKNLEDTISGIVQSQAEMKARKVQVMSGDNLPKKAKFWQKVTQQRLQDSSAITLTDKNVPKATWDQVAQVCSSTKARAVPVIPDWGCLEGTLHVDGSRTPESPESPVGGKHHYPFSLAYLAVCLARVMDRNSGTHPGKLDRSQKYACMVVVKFFAMYRGIDADDFPERLSRVFAKAGALASSPVIVPFFHMYESKKLPSEMEQILLEALQAQFGWDSKKADITKSNGNGYIDRLESRLRETLKMHRDFLMGLTVDKVVSSQKFVAQLSERLVDLDESANSFVKIVSIDIDKADLDSVIQSLLAAEDTAKDQPPFAKAERVRNPHVTMAHYTQLDQDLIQAKFKHLLAKEVEVQVTGVLWDQRIAALSVKVGAESLDGFEIPEPMNSFPHVTICHVAGVPPSESNKLPAGVETGTAQTMYMEKEVTLKGKLSFWSMQQH